MFATKKTFAAVMICAFILVCTSVHAENTNATLTYEEAVSEARMTADSVLKVYKTSLLDKGSVEAALVEKCATTAQDITSDYSKKTGYIIRRTSLKYSSPLTKPTRDEKRVLKDFNKPYKAARIKADHENHGIIKQGKVKYLLYMKPLIAQRLCLNCHGNQKQISPATDGIIKEKYPGYKATGFSVGDTLGAVSVLIPLSEQQQEQ